MPGVKPINSYDEFKTIIASGKPVVIDFWADWCGPCKFISPFLEKFSEFEETKNVEFYKVDVDEQEQIASESGIRAMPTFQLYHNGEKVNDVVGAIPTKLQALVAEGAALA